MELALIVSAMRRNKVGAILIAVQMAVTLAILCNALFIIEQRVNLSKRPTGADEANVFIITNEWIGNPPDAAARLRGDLAALRSLPGVQDAFASNSFPLRDGGAVVGLNLSPDQKDATSRAALYFGDEHAIAGLGLQLVAGHNFDSGDVVDKIGVTDLKTPAGIIVSRALADKLFPEGNAVGQGVYEQSGRGQIPIIGIIDRLQAPWVSASGFGSQFNDNSVIEPFNYVSVFPYYYIIHTQPGQMNAVLQAAPKKLFDISRARVIEKTQTMSVARATAYKDDKGLVFILGVVCIASLAVTAFGIVGLTTYWVAQRRRQIGIRRALGATRKAIIHYFQTENLLIAGAGAGIGVALAVALNLWMVNAFAIPRLHTGYVLVGAMVVLMLGQAAVLWPASKAAAIPPALATRG